MLFIVSDIQRHVKKGKWMNEHLFEYPTAPAPNKECAIPPRSQETGLPGAVSVKRLHAVARKDN
jgi:hypothetical protein